MHASNLAATRPLGESDPHHQLETVHPALASLVGRVIQTAREQGLDPWIRVGRRSLEEQDARYAIGRLEAGEIVTWVRGGGCFHNYGLAVELDLRGPTLESDWERLGLIAQTLGLKWGGDFGEPHYFQLRGFTIAQLRDWYRSGGMAAVQRHLDEALGQAAVRPLVGEGAEGESADEVRVRPGDTLGAIAQRSFGDWTRWRELVHLNGLDEGAPLKPGTRLRLR
jgi:hypothetical protein